jgi:hypothetical protein
VGFLIARFRYGTWHHRIPLHSGRSFGRVTKNDGRNCSNDPSKERMGIEVAAANDPYELKSVLLQSILLPSADPGRAPILVKSSARHGGKAPRSLPFGGNF